LSKFKLSTVKNIRVVYNLTSPFWLQPRKNKPIGIISSDKKRVAEARVFLDGIRHPNR
jgi:hypothetical protein